MTRALAYCALAYVAALGAGWAVTHWLTLAGEHPLWIALSADVAATLGVFVFSVAFNNSSFYDPYWSAAPPVLGAYFALQPTAAAANGVRQVLVLFLVTLWAVRLTYNFLRGWSGLDHEDWRYVEIRRKTGHVYWLVSWFGIHLFPTLFVFAGCLPLYAALAIGARPLNGLNLLAAVVTITAITLEATADAQLREFRTKSDRQRDEILATGLWAWSRHPNYFGEMLFWWGLFLFALAAGPGLLWTGAGAVAITLLFRFVSLRLIETRMIERRSGYAEHARRLSVFVPWPPRKAGRSS
jgi:steroid 5-alpha reductase family enzyme